MNSHLFEALYFSLKASIEDNEYLDGADSDEVREDRERELREIESRDPDVRYGHFPYEDDIDEYEEDDTDDCDW